MTKNCWGCCWKCWFSSYSFFFPFLTVLKPTVKVKNNTDFRFFFSPRDSQGNRQTEDEENKTEQEPSCKRGNIEKKKTPPQKKEDCWQVKTSCLGWDYPCLGVQTAGREQNKGRDWRDDVPFIRLCSGGGSPWVQTHATHPAISVW